MPRLALALFCAAALLATLSGESAAGKRESLARFERVEAVKEERK